MWNKAENGEGSRKYNFSAVNAPDEIVAKLSNSETDIAAISTNLAAKLYKKTEGGIKILAVNTLGVLNVLDNTGADITTLADLAGRKIVTTGQGSNPEFIINHLLGANGVDPNNDVTIEYLADGGELAAVWASEPDAVIIAPQPAATAIKAKYENARIVIDLTDEWARVNPDSALMMGCIVVRSEFLKEHTQAVKDFLADYESSISAAAADAAKTGELCEEYGIVASAKIAQAAIPGCNLCFVTGEEMRGKLTGYLQVLFDADPGSVGAMPDDGFWYEG